MDAAGCDVLSLDVPSGVDATTGVVPGPTVRADVTVSFGAPKLGALLAPARARVGRHVVVEIGFPPLGDELRSVRVATPRWALDRLPRRGPDTHKNRVGRVLVVAGQLGMAGAAILCARAAFRAGAGLVRLASVPDNRDALHAACPEAMFVDGTDAAALADAAAASDALVVGPGLGQGEAATRMLEALWALEPRPTVLDADALNIVAAGGVDLAALADRSEVVVTPHPGEMGRLMPDLDPDLDALARARAAAEHLGVTVLLKGAPSVVATPAGAAFVDTQASSDLAVAGMGDVLAGVAGSLVAQSVPVAEAGPVALYLSGRAARLAGRGAALVPSDVLRWLPDALRENGADTSTLGLPFVIYDAEAPR